MARCLISWQKGNTPVPALPLSSPLPLSLSLTPSDTEALAKVSRPLPLLLPLRRCVNKKGVSIKEAPF